MMDDQNTILGQAADATTLEDIVMDNDGSTLVQASNHLPSAAKQIKRLTQIVKKTDGTEVLRLFIAGGTSQISTTTLVTSPAAHRLLGSTFLSLTS